MITILEETTKNPLQLIGKMSGVCYGSNIEDSEKNKNRGIECLKNNHGRTIEAPNIYCIIDGYSAKLIREIYTHIGGSPLRLSASTRYIDYAKKGLLYVIPPTIEKNSEALNIYLETMEIINANTLKLENLGITKEDASMLLPLGMQQKMVLKCNLRMLIEMSHQRLCNRAFWEYRKFMKELLQKLSEIDSEWEYIIKNYMKPKCELLGYCPEKFSCGRKNKKED